MPKQNQSKPRKSKKSTKTLKRKPKTPKRIKKSPKAPAAKTRTSKKAFKIDNRFIQKAVKCLRQMAEKQQKLTVELTEMGKDPLVYLNILLRDLPKESNVKPSLVRLQKSLYPSSSPRFCLFVSNQFMQEYKDVLEDLDLPNWDIISFEELRTDYKTFKAKRELLEEYELFFCEGRIYMLIKKMLGRGFYQRKRFPFPIEFNNCIKATPKHESGDEDEAGNSESEDIEQETEEQAKHNIKLARFNPLVYSRGGVDHVRDYSGFSLNTSAFNKLLSSLTDKSAYFYPGNGPEYCLKVARLGSATKNIDVIKNVRKGVKGMMTRLIKMGSRLKDVRRISLKLAQSQSLPIFSALTEREIEIIEKCREEGLLENEQ